MEEMPIISAEELFGATSRLVVDKGGAVFGDIASLGSLYQVVVAVVAVAYIFAVLKFSDVLLYILGSLLGRGNTQHANDKVYSSVINNVERLMAVVGIALIALCAMRLSITAEGAHLFAPLNLSAWGLFGVTAGGVGALILAESLALYLIRLFVQDGALWRELLHTKLLHFSAVVTVITPPLLLVLLTQGTGAIVAGGAVVLLCFISVIIFAKVTFSLFISHRFSLFHWILYLCALEFFPLSLLLAPILRK